MFNLSQSAATSVNVLSNIVLIVGAVMALAGTFGAFWSSSVLGRYADERAQANERMTAQANDSAAQATLRAAQLEKDTESLKVDAEKAKAEAERLKLQIKQMQEVRRLTKGQVETLSQLLKSADFQREPKLKLGVASVPDAEAQMLALDFIALLRSCEIDFYPTPGGQLPRGIVQINDSDLGLSLTIQSMQLTQQMFYYNRLQKTMREAGLPISVELDPTLTPGHAQINVLRKPAVISRSA